MKSVLQNIYESLYIFYIRHNVIHQVRSIPALAALAEAASPYGIQSFDVVLGPVLRAVI